MAVWHQQAEIVEFICQDETLQSLINHCDEVILSLENRKINFWQQNGDTPLHLAVEVKNEKIYKLLMDVSGSLHTVNKVSKQLEIFVDMILA